MATLHVTPLNTLCCIFRCANFLFRFAVATSCPVPCRLAGSFAGLGFLSWYLAGKIKAFDRGGHVAKLCIVAMPLLLAAMVAVSRVDDYWHHWQDVFTAGVLGTRVPFQLNRIASHHLLLVVAKLSSGF